MLETQEVFQELQKKAETNKPSLRFIQEMLVGQWIAQGDLQVKRIKKLPSKHGPQTKKTQLAIGQTQGSRHIIDPLPSGLVIYQPSPEASPLTGPIIFSPSRWTLTHPEHGHFSLPEGTYQVSYQRDWSKEHAEELRRVRD